jgi:phage terminase Nu1 subunit (DNA packaging protein)
MASTKGKFPLPETCSGPQLASWLGISDRTVREWAARGVIVRDQPGRYRTLESIRAYTAALRREAEVGPSASSKLADEKTRMLAITRQIRALELARLQGEILSIDELDKAWTRFSRLLNAGIVSLPSRARSEITHLTEHDERTLMRLAQNALLDLAKMSGNVLGATSTREFGVLPD